jgi:hypothetical protein
MTLPSLRTTVGLIVASLWTAFLVGLGYVGMATGGRLGAVGAAIIAGTLMYAFDRLIGESDRLTSGLFSAGYSLAALTGAALSVSVETAIPFVIALLAWTVIDTKRRQDITDAEAESETPGLDAVESEVNV